MAARHGFIIITLKQITSKSKSYGKEYTKYTKKRQKKKYIRKLTGVIDALEHSQKLKWRWAGHIARMDKEKWTQRVTIWQGPTNRKKRG